MSRLHPAVGIALAVAMVGAIDLAAIRPPGESVANGTFCATLLILGLATLGAAFRRGRARAYWAGFALFGWAYLALVLGPWCDENIEPRLITHSIFRALQGRHGPYPITQPSVPILSEPVRYAPREIGHALSSLLLGLVGGASAWHLSADEVEPVAPTGPHRG